MIIAPAKGGCIDMPVIEKGDKREKHHFQDGTVKNSLSADGQWDRSDGRDISQKVNGLSSRWSKETVLIFAKIIQMPFVIAQMIWKYY